MYSRTFSTDPFYPDSIKRAILLEVFRIPGRRGRAIAAALNLDRKKVNRFLHKEGKRRYGLRQVDCCWYPPAATIPAPQPIPVAPPTNDPKTICGVLSEIDLSEATIKIRSFSLEIVCRAFAENGFELLDDKLKKELSIRRAELMASPPLQNPTFQVPNIWIPFILLCIVILANIFVSHNQQPSGGQAPNPSLSP